MPACNSQLITSTVDDGIEYFSTVRKGVEYTAYQLRSGSWFVASRRLALGRRHIGGGKHYESLDALVDGCKAFAALGALMALRAITSNA